MTAAVAIAAMICSVFATLFAIVFCLGMGANAKPSEIRALKVWALGLTSLGVAGISAGIFLLRAAQPGLAASVSIAPAVILFVVFIIAVKK